MSDGSDRRLCAFKPQWKWGENDATLHWPVATKMRSDT